MAKRSIDSIDQKSRQAVREGKLSRETLSPGTAAVERVVQHRREATAAATKSVEDAAKHSIQSRAHDDGDIGLGGIGGIGGLLTYLFRAGELVSPWWSTQRDIDLRRFIKSSDHLSGTVSLLTSKIINVPFRVEPRDFALKSHMKQADEYTRIIAEESELGQGWTTLCSKVADDWFNTDCGLFMEVIGEGPLDGPIQGPALGLASLDSTRVIRKKDHEYPIAYIDEDGSQYKLHYTRVAYASDQPSNIVEMRGIGFCSVSRSINVSQRLVDQSLFYQEKLGSRPLRAVMFTPGIPTDVVEATLQMADEVMDNQALKRFSKIPILGGNDTNARFELIPFSTLPDGFDEETSTRLAMFAMALGFGVPIRWIWPAATSGATKADAQYQHIAGLGGGLGRLLKVLTFILGGDPRGSRHTVGKLLPPHLKLVFDFQDDEQDRMKAENQKMRTETIATGLETGVITLRVAREKALEAGDITEAQFNQMELTDGRLPTGEDVLTMFYSGDKVIRELLDLGVEDPLDVNRNDALSIITAVEDKQGEIRKAMAGAGSPRQKETLKQALAALGKLREAYEEGESAQQQADDAETEEQARGEDQPDKAPGDGGKTEPAGTVVEKEESEEEPVEEEEKGGLGSGNFGHGGRPGKVGGSTPAGSAADDTTTDTPLGNRLDSLKSELASAAQRIVRDYDPEWYSGGGVCDDVANEMAGVLSEAGIDTVPGGQEGSDHAYLIAYDSGEGKAYVVDIPPGVYESGGGYSWEVNADAEITAGDVIIDEIPEEDLQYIIPDEMSMSTKVWSSLSSVPSHLRKMHGIPLTLAQANHMARIADAVEAESGDTSIAWATARKKFQQMYEIRDGAWVRKKKEDSKEVSKVAFKEGLVGMLSDAVSTVQTLWNRLRGSDDGWS